MIVIQSNSVGYKYLNPDQLTQVLTKVPKDAMISVNSVGNMCVTDHNNIYIGYIDFLGTGEFVSNKDE